MIPVLHAQAIRDWDQYTIENEPISSIDLMYSAAQTCVDYIVDNYSYDDTFIVCCGNGNNGGDGFCIAYSLLQMRFNTKIIILENKNRSADNLYYLQRLQNEFPESLFTFDKIKDKELNGIYIDCIFGTGLHTALSDIYTQWISYIQSHASHIISIDTPSGLHCDEINLYNNNQILKADVTLSFQCYKKTFLVPETGKYCGKIIILDIGLSSNYPYLFKHNEWISDSAYILSMYKKRNEFVHKGNMGHVLIVAGKIGSMGAAVLSTSAAMRSGAGLCTTLIPLSERCILQTTIPEAMLTFHDQEINTSFLQKYNSIVIGCAIGLNTEANQILENVLKHSTIPVILDADALHILSLNKNLLTSLLPNSLLTPHEKEFERIWGKIDNSINKIKLQREISMQHKIFILRKGKYTCMTCPDGNIYYNTSGSAGMATAGSGDVLSGIIGALYAQYQDMKTAMIMGAYIHGKAGEQAALLHSEESMIASDIVENLGGVFKELRN